MNSERLKLGIPSGEMEKDILSFMQTIGLDFRRDNPRQYFISVDNMPVDFVIVRAGSIPKYVADSRSCLKAGITGGDILWEYGWEKGREAGDEVPLYDVKPDAKRSSLFVGVTTAFYERMPASLSKFIDNATIVTKYPNIARKYMESFSLNNFDIFSVPGTDEAIQFIYPYDAIVGTLSSGDTVQANGIKILDVFYDVTLRIIGAFNGKLSRLETDILSDVQEKMYTAMLDKRRG